MKNKLAIIGLGYVGIPMAYAFSKKYDVIGYTRSKKHRLELQNGYDKTNELSSKKLKNAIKNGLQFTNKIKKLKDCNIYIVCVPTPIDKNYKPNLSHLIEASKNIGKVLKKNDIIIYESTVYPGATEEVCVPELEKSSKLKYNKDFFCGYSPERINPSDTKHTFTKILKVTSGSNLKTAKKVDKLYRCVVKAGTYMAPSIKVAEASKVIENTQRDINIAFMNELSKIFEKIDIDTYEVLKAASTKWNFLNFQPGLVGGHCIGVDPYYLTEKSQNLGYTPQLILKAREINESMGMFIAMKTIELMKNIGINIKRSKVLVLGITFKENCKDIRNSKVLEIINHLKENGCSVDVSDYVADNKEVKKEYNINLLESYNLAEYDAIILGVAHKKYVDISYDEKRQVLFDVKAITSKFSARL